MSKVPGYDKMLRQQAQVKQKKGKRAEIAARNAQRKEIERMVKPSNVVNVVSAGIGVCLAPAVVIWAVKHYCAGQDDVLRLWLAMLGCVVALPCGVGCCELGQRLRKRAGVRLVKKIDDGKSLNYFEQRQFGRLFTAQNIGELASSHPNIFAQLCADGLSHISYDVSTAIMEGYLKKSPDDFFMLSSRFDLDSIPAHIRAKYGREK